MEVGEQASSLPIFGVVDFLATTNQILDYGLPMVQIIGEVSSFKINQDKFIFFDLKEEASLVNCFMMRFKLRQSITDGMKVIITGKPNLTRMGKFSITVESVKPFGQGEIKKQRDLLFEKLKNEGLFDEARKRALPRLPERIGVISSTGAAGYQDFLKIINERWSRLELVVRSTLMQGDSAADEMIEALDELNQMDLDVIVMIRGGGSRDDLACFDDERLARAIDESYLPVATGIGHEIDISLADLVADFRAATPSHLAQAIVPSKKTVLDSLEHGLKYIQADLVQACDRQLDWIDQCHLEALQALFDKFDQTESRVLEMARVLKALNPQRVLERGYAIVRGIVAQQQLIEIELKDKIIAAEVKEIYDKK